MAKVLFVASEAAPFIKSGGLADVMGALPQELRALGVETALVIPKYSKMAEQYDSQLELVYEGTVDLSWRNEYFGVYKLTLDGFTTYFIDNEWYFKRDALYGWGDDDERFAFFAKAVLAVLPHIGFRPDLIHCNDWHTGLVPVYLQELFAQDEYYQGIQTVFTVHNLKYQGIFPPQIVTDVLGLPTYIFDNGNIECDGCVNYIKSGMVYADFVTTVSPSYAKEITYPYYGERLDSFVRTIQDKLQGIVNGLDDKAYNPATDPYIAAQYTPETLFTGKQACKENLQRTLGLPVNPRVPVIAMVSRLVEDKGMDLALYIMDELLQEDVQLVVLGTGDAQYEDAMRGLAGRYPTKASVNICFSEALAHQIYAGSDIFMMPSRFEACGLSQLIAMKYGTIPVVRECGGLKDTVIPFDKMSGEGNGLRFLNFNAHELLFTVKRALSYYYDATLWERLVLNAATSDYSWQQSAQQYKYLYGTLLGYDPAVAPVEEWTDEQGDERPFEAAPETVGEAAVTDAPVEAVAEVTEAPAAEAAEVPVTEAAVATEAEVPAEPAEAPAPKKTRKPRAKKTEAGAAKAEKAPKKAAKKAAETAEKTEKPAPKKRAPRKQKVNEAEAVPATEKTTETAEKPAPKKRASRKQKADADKA